MDKLKKIAWFLFSCKGRINRKAVILFYGMLVVSGVIYGMVLVSQQLIHAAECRKMAAEQGTDPEKCRTASKDTAAGETESAYEHKESTTVNETEDAQSVLQAKVDTLESSVAKTRTKLLANILFAIVLIWTSIAIQVKRLHDMNRTGWFVLLYFIPYVGQIGMLIWLAFFKGTQGVNRFGAQPGNGA